MDSKDYLKTNTSKVASDTSKGKVRSSKNAITFRLPEEIADKLQDQIKQQGDKELTHLAYYLLGVLYAHDIFKTNPQLALDVVARIRFGRGGSNTKIDRLLKTAIRKATARKKHESERGYIRTAKNSD